VTAARRVPLEEMGLFAGAQAQAHRATAGNTRKLPAPVGRCARRGRSMGNACASGTLPDWGIGFSVARHVANRCVMDLNEL